MVGKYIQAAYDWLKRAITQPMSELDRWEKAARFAHDLGNYGARQLRRDRAPQMAGALAFRTLFGLLPVLVMGAVVIRALRGPDEFFGRINDVLIALGLYEIGEQGNTLGDMIASFAQQAATYNASAIGTVGMLVLVYSAISLMVTIENSFNTVYRAPEGRSWWKRMPMYWFVLTLGPVVIGVSFMVDQRVDDWIAHVQAWKWLLASAAVLWELATTWFVLAVAYLLIPNTAIRVRPALLGAFVAALLLLVGKRFLGVYLSNAVSITQFEGSLGLIPLFMFWVYVMWLVVLFGLEVAATLQSLAGRTLGEMEERSPRTGLFDPASILAVMEVIAERFAESAPTSRRELADKCGLPESTVGHVLNHLIDAGLLHRLESGEGAVTLARPPERIAGSELMDIAFEIVDSGSTARQPVLVGALREAQRDLAAQSTLAGLVSR